MHLKFVMLRCLCIVVNRGDFRGMAFNVYDRLMNREKRDIWSARNMNEKDICGG